MVFYVSKNTQCQLHLMHFYWKWHQRQREKKTPKTIWYCIMFIKNATIFPGKGDCFFLLFCRTICHWSTVREGYYFFFFAIVSIHYVTRSMQCVRLLCLFISMESSIFYGCGRNFVIFTFFSTASLYSQRTGQLNFGSFCLIPLISTKSHVFICQGYEREKKTNLSLKITLVRAKHHR